MIADPNKRYEVKLDKEEKVILLNSTFYPLKGVLICEATDEDRKMYGCDRFMTFPIVGEDWKVMECESIRYGIETLTIGRKGDVVLVNEGLLLDAIYYDFRNHEQCYEGTLRNLERCGICVSNQKSLDSPELISDTIVLVVSRSSRADYIYSVTSRSHGYFLVPRNFYVGKDDELYILNIDDKGKLIFTDEPLIDSLATDISDLAHFFNRPKLQTLVTRMKEGCDIFNEKLDVIPKDWFYTIQTLDTDLNNAIRKEIGNKSTPFYEAKLPIPGIG